MKKYILFLFALIFSGGLYGAATGPLIFSDDFETGMPIKDSNPKAAV